MELNGGGFDSGRPGRPGCDESLKRLRVEGCRCRLLCGGKKDYEELDQEINPKSFVLFFLGVSNEQVREPETSPSVGSLCINPAPLPEKKKHLCKYIYIYDLTSKTHT